MKWLLGSIAFLFVLAGIGYLSLQRLSGDDLPINTPLTPTGKVSDVSPSSSVVVSSTPVFSETGVVSGKLCYPSETLPPGVIEAKRTTDNVVFTQDYAGSQQGVGNTYEFELEIGTYILRYGADSGGTGDYAYGYKTANCPTGVETTCGEAEGMEAVLVEVVAGDVVPDYDLCNFYYTESNEPEF